MALSNLCIVTVVIFEECCMASADMQWLFYSDKRIVAHGPLVFIIIMVRIFSW